MTNIINWSKVSRILTNDRTAIRSDYSGKKYKTQADGVKKAGEELEKWLETFKNLQRIIK
jgi:hypothetical protein